MQRSVAEPFVGEELLLLGSRNGEGLTAMVWLTALGFLEVRVRFVAITLLYLLSVNVLDVVPLKAYGNYLLSPRGLSYREAH